MHEIRGAGIFMVVDQKQRIYKVTLINLKSIVPLRLTQEGFDENVRDAGFTFGIASLRDTIKSLLPEK